MFCHFPLSSWPTWKLHHPFSGGKATSVDLSCFTRPNNTFFSTSSLVNKVFGSRAAEGHSSSLLNQRKSHLPSLFISAFSTVFFKTTLSIQSNIYQSFSRLRLLIVFYFCLHFVFCWIVLIFFYSNHFALFFHVSHALIEPTRRWYFYQRKLKEKATKYQTPCTFNQTKNLSSGHP